MSSLFGAEIHIGVSPSAVALLNPGRWPRRRTTLVAERQVAAAQPAELPAGQPAELPPAQPGASLSTLLATLDALLAEHGRRGSSARIVVADHWARYAMVTPPSNASRLADCQAAATARLQGLYGESGSDWELQADWQARSPFLACALPQRLLTGLRRVAAEHRLVVLDVLPHFVAAWNRWCSRLQPGSWFGVVHDDALTVAAVAGHGLQAVRTLRRVAGADAAWLRRSLEREATRCLLPLPAAVALSGDVPLAWTQGGVPGWVCTALGAAPPGADASSADASVADASAADASAQPVPETRLARLLAMTGAH